MTTDNCVWCLWLRWKPSIECGGFAWEIEWWGGVWWLTLFMCLLWSHVLSLLLDCRPVVDRRLLTFLVSPRKRKQKKATALRCPSGSRLCKSKNGKCPQLAALRQGHFFSHFLPCTTGSSEAEFQVKNNGEIAHNQGLMQRECFFSVGTISAM